MRTETTELTVSGEASGSAGVQGAGLDGVAAPVIRLPEVAEAGPVWFDDPVFGVLSGALDRLEETIDLETAALQGGTVVDLDEFNRRKSQSLLELSRVMRVLPPARPIDADIAARLSTMQDKLLRNQAALEVHLAAVREIADTVSHAIQDAESDGTYSTAVSQRSGAR